MKRKFLIVLALAFSVSVLCLPLAAHHGNAVYDVTKQINLKGTVTQFVWANPHSSFSSTSKMPPAKWCTGWRRPKIPPA